MHPDITHCLSRPLPGRRGFTLVLTLIVLAAITLLVLGLFANVTSESATATNYDNAFRAQTAVRSGLSRVEALLQRGTWSDDYLVFEHLQNPPLAGTVPTDDQWRKREPVLMLARANVTGDTAGTAYAAAWEYTPLTSGVNAPAPTPGTPVLPSSVTRLTPKEDASSKKANEVAASLPKRLPWQLAQDSYWEVIYEDQDADGDPATPATKVPVARYAFHVEDLQGLLSLDVAGNPGDAIETAMGMMSRQHEREKTEVFDSSSEVANAPRRWYAGLAPGLRTPDDDVLTDDRRWAMSQAALYTLADPTASTDNTSMDNQIMVARHTQRSNSPTQVASLLVSPDSWKPILMKEDISNPWPMWLQRAPLKMGADGKPVLDVNAGRLPDSAARRLEENTITGLQPYYEYPLVPAEPGVFAQPRQPKMNLNRVLTQVQGGTLTNDEAVKLIAAHIQKHLPSQIGSAQTTLDGFAKRGGAFPFTEPTPLDNAPAYLQNLAAGIIDYADTDSTPVFQQGLYRGFDSAPVIHEHILMHRWENSTIRDGRRMVRYTATFYYELWNMSNRTVVGEYEAEHVNRAEIQVGTGNHILDEAYDLIVANRPYGNAGSRWMPLFPAHPTNGQANPATSVVTLRPNEITVLGTLPITYEFDAGPGAISLDEVTVRDDNQSHLHLRFKPSAQTDNPEKLITDVKLPVTPMTFVSIDRTGGGVERNERRLSLSSPLKQQQFACNPINFSTGDSSNTNALRNNNGDPRGAFYLTDVQTLSKYASDGNGDGGASPFGRNKRYSVSSNNIYGEVFVSRWGDRGHDGPVGVYPGSNLSSPFAATVVSQKPAYTSTQRQAAPMRISNAGRYFSATELGNIYDPVFWDPNGGTQTNNPLVGAQAWSLFDDIASGASPSAFFTGGHTLRIGRPEHTRFRSNRTGGSQINRRLSATTLLDLFHCGISTVGSVNDPVKGAEHLRDLTGPLTEIRGQVNLNTASREVLKALVAGGLKTDPWIPNATASAQAASTLVEAIIRARPFLSTAELAERTRATDGQPAFGDDKLMTLFGAGAQWNDTAKEEVFARLYNSSTVRSRHFRVFVTGQAVRPLRSDPTRLEVLSTRSRVAHVFVQPLRDPTTGLIHDQRIQITYEQDL